MNQKGRRAKLTTDKLAALAALPSLRLFDDFRYFPGIASLE
ncbi:hypothetical protein ABTX62_31315 [Streptomyces sp. NPDC096046]